MPSCFRFSAPLPSLSLSSSSLAFLLLLLALLWGPLWLCPETRLEIPQPLTAAAAATAKTVPLDQPCDAPESGAVFDTEVDEEEEEEEEASSLEETR